MADSFCPEGLFAHPKYPNLFVQPPSVTRYKMCASSVLSHASRQEMYSAKDWDGGSGGGRGIIGVGS
eukprot:8617381-Ditylum_brightwellii.AAC.1